MLSFFHLQKSLGVTATNGIDRLICFQIVSELNKVLADIDLHFTRNKYISECFAKINDCLTSETPNGIVTCMYRLALCTE